MFLCLRGVHASHHLANRQAPHSVFPAQKGQLSTEGMISRVEATKPYKRTAVSRLRDMFRHHMSYFVLIRPRGMIRILPTKRDTSSSLPLRVLFRGGRGLGFGGRRLGRRGGGCGIPFYSAGDDSHPVQHTLIAVPRVCHLYPYPLDVQKAIAIIGVAVQAAVERVIRLRGDERDAVGVESHDQNRVIPPLILPVILDHIPNHQPRNIGLGRKRSHPLVLGHKVVEKFHARPCGGALAVADIVPSVHRSVVHCAAPRVDRLGHEIGAIPPATGVVDKERIARKRPPPCIDFGAFSLVWFYDKHDRFPPVTFSPYCMHLTK